MVGVKVNGNLMEALKRFNKKVYDSGIMLEYNENRFYKKPSQKRNEIKQLHKRRNNYKRKNK